MLNNKIKLSLQTTITLLVSGVIIACLLITSYFIKQNIEKTTLAHIEENAQDISRTVALSPIVIDALSGKADKSLIQQFAEKIRTATNVQYIVVLDMNRIRLSHPDPNEIGKKFVGGDEGPVFSGKDHISVAKGTLGRSLRSFTPVFDSNGKQIGAVAVGVLLNMIDQKEKQSIQVIFFSMFIGSIVGLIGAVLLGRKVKKIMFGMEPGEIAHLLEERSAVLEFAREGIMAFDKDSNITLVNQEAARLIKKMGIDDDPKGRKVKDVIPELSINSVIDTGCKALDQEIFFNDQSVIANIIPIRVDHRISGAVATFRDKTEIRQMAEQLTGARSYAEALRAQTHEFMNKLHVILGMVQLEYYDQLIDFVQGITEKFQTEVGFITSRFKDPVLAGFILGKVSFVRENGGKLSISEASFMPTIKDSEIEKDIITILGNLIDNSLDSLKGRKVKNIEVEIVPLTGNQLSITVSDTGIGMSNEVLKNAFDKGFSTKGNDRGFGLYIVNNSANKLNGKVKIASELGKGTRINVVFPYEG